MASSVKEGIERFISYWNTAIGMLKTNYLVDPLLNRKINLRVQDTDEEYLLSLTNESAMLEEGTSSWAHADFTVDRDTWLRFLRGEINTVSMVTAGKISIPGDQVLILLRFGIIVQLLVLMFGEQR
jgi:alkyl sulfatase BDS1-like metallo-beta-lactamase superfamily hydrolase